MTDHDALRERVAEATTESKTAEMVCRALTHWWKNVGAGDRPHALFIDDPLDAADAASRAERDRVNDWYDQIEALRSIEARQLARLVEDADAALAVMPQTAGEVPSWALQLRDAVEEFIQLDIDGNYDTHRLCLRNTYSR